MFDELRDPDPPQPSLGNLQAVTARAKQLRIRRYGVVGTACAVLFVAGTGAVVAVTGNERELAPSVSDPPITTAVETTLPGTTTLPDGSTMPGTTVPVTTAPPTAISTTTTPTPPATTCSGPTSGLLAVRDGDAVRVLADGSLQTVATKDQAGGTIRRVLQAPDGVVWLEVGRGRNDRVVGVLNGSTLTTVRTGEVTLEAVGSLNGTSVAAITNSANPEGNDFYGTFEMIDAAKTVVATIPDPFSPTGSISSVTISANVIAVGHIYDLGEGFTYHDATGSEIERFDPNTNGTPDDPSDDRIQYAAAPLAIAPVQLTGGELAWLEGPEQKSGAELERVGDWQLVIADQQTGAERVRVQIGGLDEDYRSTDSDGGWLVVNFGDYEEGRFESPPTRSVVIDLSVPEPAPLAVCAGLTDVGLTRS